MHISQALCCVLSANPTASFRHTHPFFFLETGLRVVQAILKLVMQQKRALLPPPLRGWNWRPVLADIFPKGIFWKDQNKKESGL